MKQFIEHHELARDSRFVRHGSTPAKPRAEAGQDPHIGQVVDPQAHPPGEDAQTQGRRPVRSRAPPIWEGDFVYAAARMASSRPASLRWYYSP